jgi:hypothetical protein
LVEKAQRVLRGILRDSELKEVWYESGDPGLWFEAVEGLLQRLSGGAA